MNGDTGMASELLGKLRDLEPFPLVDIVVCPPAPYLLLAKEKLKDSPVAWGGQDCHSEPKGAYTGDISAPMLRDCGASYVILGHSERRQNHGETNEMIRKKARAAIDIGISPIICIGETEAEREQGYEKKIIENQVINSIPESGDIEIAYEPIWAIGTGKTAKDEQISEMHSFIRQLVKDRPLRILYGGSVKAENAAQILSLPNVGGALVGGASLKVEEFTAIVVAANIA